MDHVWYKHYESGVARTIDPSIYSSIPKIFDVSFQKYAQNKAFYSMGTSVTYSQFQELAFKFADFLTNELKMVKGDRLAIMMPNILQYPVAVVGALYAGIVVVNCNPLYTARELEHQLSDSGATGIVIFENSAAILEKVIARTKIKHVVTTQVGDMLSFPKSKIVNFVVKHVKKMVPAWKLSGSLSFKAALAKGQASRFTPAKLTHGDIAFLQYTGGTTGVSKGAILTHGNVVSNVLQCLSWFTNSLKAGEEIVITPLPLYHIFSLTANLMIFSSLGGLNVLIINPRDLKAFLGDMKKFKFTVITGVNSLFNLMLNDQRFKELDFSNLRFSLGGGMAVQKSVAEKWQSATGCALLECYGLTETSPAASINPSYIKNYSGFIGLPISSTEIVIKDDDGNTLSNGEVGEICIRGPQVMKGYWNRPDETAKVMTPDHFFRTGDLGFMNDNGFTKIVDRKKDMILVSGFNVYPNEVEEVMSSHPKVLECAAVGVPDEKSGEVVKLFVVKKDPTLTVEELEAHARENLTGYKLPKHYEFRTELPKTNVGKILRRELRTA